jgi:hypothetical protein
MIFTPKNQGSPTGGRPLPMKNRVPENETKKGLLHCKPFLI